MVYLKMSSSSALVDLPWAAICLTHWETKKDRMKMWFFDNTDPDGIDKVIDNIGSNLVKRFVSSFQNLVEPKKRAMECWRRRLPMSALA